jgi:hypothetical protein
MFFWRVGDVGTSTFFFMVFEGLQKFVERLQSSKKMKNKKNKKIVHNPPTPLPFPPKTKK